MQDNIVLHDCDTVELFCREYRMPFKGFTDLQKAILADSSFWDLRQNLIIKGEPGSGKTLVAEWAFLSLPLYKQSRIRKMLYLLPYRALLNEKYNYFLHGYNRSCFRIFRSSSDFYEEDNDILTANCDIGIMIYEKLEHIFRLGLNQDQLFYEYDLIVMDEFSIISTIDRGIIVNNILKRYMSLPVEREHRKKARILSLTVPECRTAEYSSMNFRTISNEKKPVYINEAIIQADRGIVIPKNGGTLWPIEYDNLSIVSKSDNGDEIESKDDLKYYENKQLLQYLIEAHRKQGHNIIVFCSSKENSRNLCLSISKVIKKSHVPHGNWKERLELIQGKIGDNAYGCIDFLMLQSAEYGVTYHNADLPSELRREIEKEYQKKDGRLDIVVSTETLAYGINCSADVIIIYDRIKPTSIDDFPNFKYGYDLYMRYINSVEYKNYIGRAGRLGYAENQDMNMSYAYLFSKDASGTKKVWSNYYADYGRRFRSGKQLFAIKLRQKPLTVTSMVFDQIQLDNEYGFYKKDVLEALKFLSGKEKFLHEKEMIDMFIDKLKKLQLITDEETIDYEAEKERYVLTRFGEAVYGTHIPYDILCSFQDILKDIRENGCSLFSLVYQLSKRNYDGYISNINRKKNVLNQNMIKIMGFWEDLEKKGIINEKIYKRVKRNMEWLMQEIDGREPNDYGYIYLSEEMADKIHNIYDSLILYLWSQGVSIQSINIDYGLPARYGSIKNRTRNLIHIIDCLVHYLQSFMDLQILVEKVEQIKQSIRFGMPYFCIEALGGQVVSEIRPEICELLVVAEKEQCERILRSLLLYHVKNTSSISEIMSFRKKLKKRTEEIKNG